MQRHKHLPARSMQKLQHSMVTLILLFVLSACETLTDTGTLVSGNVGGTPVAGSTLSITDAKGNLVATTTSSENADYSILVPENTEFPLIIRSIGGTAVVTNRPPDFDMQTVMLGPQNTIANINPFSTLIVDIALAMDDGLTASNINTATQYVYDNFNFGLDRTLIESPISTEITTNNIAAILKASETFSEVLRRSFTALTDTDSSLTIDAMIKSLARDIKDGKLDGTGNLVTPKITATFVATSSEVLLESIENKLMVNDKNATEAMDAAIKLSIPAMTTAISTTNVKITEEILSQTSNALDAVNTAEQHSNLLSLSTTLKNTTPEAISISISTLLSDEIKTTLTNTINNFSGLDENQIDAVNIVIAGTIDDTPTNPDDSQPIAKNDSASTNNSTSVNINVLSNDTGLENTPVTVSVTTQADQGFAIVETDKTITYSPNGAAPGTYSFIYQVTDNDSDAASANVTITISCDTCANDVNLLLSWDANPANENVTGYKIYFRKMNESTSTLLEDLAISTTGFDSSSPSMQYNAGTDMTLAMGDTVCISILAYNLIGSSSTSDEVCSDI